MTRFLQALLLCAVCVSLAYAGDQSGIEPKTKTVSPSFSPPITPTITGSPGADKYLQSDGGGVVSWASKPSPGSSIPLGTGWVKQTAPGIFASFSSVPSAQTSSEFRPPPASFGVCSLGYHFQALECGV